MTETRRRWILPAAAAVMIALVAFATCRSDETPPAPDVAPPPVAAKPPAPHKSRRGSGASDAAKSAGSHGSGGASQASEIPEDDGFPFVDVEVVKHDGTPASNAAIVYALRAGTTTDVEPPNVDVEDGACRLHVLRAGKYDVGAVDCGVAALATDVDVPRGEPLRIVLPEPADVVLLAEPPLFPDKDAWHGAFFHIAAAGENVAPFPGRGQQTNWSRSSRIEEDTTSVSLVVAKGATGRVRFDSLDVATVPGTFTAPATLHVVRAGRYPLTLRVTFESPGASFPREVALRAEFRVGDVGEPTVTSLSVLAANQQIGSLFPRPSELRADANSAEGTITWKGNGVISGSQPFSGLARDVANVVDIALRLTPDAPEHDATDRVPGEPAAPATVTVQATGGDGAGLPAQVLLFVADATGAIASSDAAPGADANLLAHDGAWALATRGTWTADPVRLTGDTLAAGAALTLRPGGWLVVSMARKPPVSLGTILIRRRDGAPFFTQNGAQVAPSVVAEQSAVLGPFPEGGVDFVLELSGEVVGEMHATVRAGTREKLVIPSLAPR